MVAGVVVGIDIDEMQRNSQLQRQPGRLHQRVGRFHQQIDSFFSRLVADHRNLRQAAQRVSCALAGALIHCQRPPW